MSTQTKNGKAFEYACANNIYLELSQSQEVIVEQNSSYKIAKSFFESFSEDVQAELNLAANAAVKMLGKLEPLLVNDDGDVPLIVSIQEDAKGQSGDVRDVLFIRKGHLWEIGISVKHNHSAVKHSRLSDSIDFGSKWFDIPCSQEYFLKIKPIFDELRKLKEEKVKWSELENKADRFYVPILEAFMEEIKRIDLENPNTVPSRMLQYLLGRNDFYKVISRKDRRMTQIQAFSLFGTLNKPAGPVKPQIKLPQLKMPNKFYEIGFKPESDNTILVVMNEGWQLSFRIHSASTFVEPSLKFDIKLVGQPNFYSHFESWE